jgi:TolA-binding protein
LWRAFAFTLLLPVTLPGAVCFAPSRIGVCRRNPKRGGKTILDCDCLTDGSKFKAVNTQDRNLTQAKMQRRLAQIDESIARYLSQLDSADRQGEAVPEAKITRLNEKIAALRQEIQRLNGLNTQIMQTEDKQISLTDPDARSMATSGRGSGMVGYNVQSAVDTKHHLIVTP